MLIIQIMDIFIFMLGLHVYSFLTFYDHESTRRLVRAPVNASWCDIYHFLLLLVQCGASFLKFLRCGAVLYFHNFFGIGAVRF